MFQEKISNYNSADTKETDTVFIKITNGRTINKNPIFIAKGRRIGEIKMFHLFVPSTKAIYGDIQM